MLADRPSPLSRPGVVPLSCRHQGSMLLELPCRGGWVGGREGDAVVADERVCIVILLSLRRLQLAKAHNACCT